MTKDKKTTSRAAGLGQKLNVQKSTSHHPLWMHPKRLMALGTDGYEPNQ